jgi:hypothetical protein
MIAAALLAVVLVLVAAPAAQAKAPPAVGCAQHIEGDGPLPGPDRSRDVVRGALALLGAREIQRHRVPIGNHGVRLGIHLEAGHEATIAVAPESRDVAQLEYRFMGGRRARESQVRFRACAGDEPRFSGPGTVGPHTIWVGGLHVRRPGCVRLQLWVDGAAVDGVRLPFGRPCRPPPAMRSVGCAQRSMASFPGAYEDPRNLVAGPMAIVGGAQAAEAAAAKVIRELGWWKSPLLLREGAEAVLSVAWESRRLARIGFATGPDGRAMRFTACGPDERSGSDVDAQPVTFWSGGFTLRRVPACVAFDLWVAGAPARRLRVPFGAPRACA